MAPAELVADLCLRWSRGNIWRIDWPGDVDGIVFIGTEAVVVYNYNTAEWIWNLQITYYGRLVDAIKVPTKIIFVNNMFCR